MVEQVRRKTTVDKVDRSIAVERGNTRFKLGVDDHHKDRDIVSTAYGLANGEVPSNKYIKTSFEKAKAALDSPSIEDQLNSHGKSLRDDTKGVLTSVQRYILKKNHGETLQHMMKEAKLATDETVGTSKPNLSGLKTNVTDPRHRAELKENLNNIRRVFMFIAQSSEFRGLLLDMFSFLQTVIEDAKAKQPELKQALKRDHHNTGTLPTTGVTTTTNVVPTSGLTTTTTTTNATTTQNKNVISTLANEININELGDKEAKKSMEQRFKNLLIQLSKHPEYKNVMTNVFKLIETFTARAENFNTKSKTTIEENRRFKEILEDAKILIGRFAGKRETDDFFSNMWALLSEFKKDEQARLYFSQSKQLMLDSLEKPDIVQTDEFSHRIRLTNDQGKKAFRQNRELYKQKFRAFFDSSKGMFRNLKNDKDRTEVERSLRKLVDDLLIDQDGRPDIFILQDSVEQMRRIIIPVVKKRLEYIPLPLIEVSDSRYDFRVQNLTFNANDIIPDHVDVFMNNELQFLPSELGMGKAKSAMQIVITDIRTKFNDVKFYYNRKKFPKISNNGIADVAISGRGIQLEIFLKQQRDFREGPFSISVTEVKCQIDKLDIKIKQADKHKFLDKLAVKLLSGTIKKRIARQISEKLNSALLVTVTRINEFFARKEPSRGTMNRMNSVLKKAYDKKGNSRSFFQRASEKAKSLKDQVKTRKDELRMKSKTHNQTQITEQGNVQPEVLQTRKTQIVPPVASPKDNLVAQRTDEKPLESEAQKVEQIPPLYEDEQVELDKNNITNTRDKVIETQQNTMASSLV